MLDDLGEDEPVVVLRTGPQLAVLRIVQVELKVSFTVLERVVVIREAGSRDLRPGKSPTDEFRLEPRPDVKEMRLSLSLSLGWWASASASASRRVEYLSQWYRTYIACSSSSLMSEKAEPMARSTSSAVPLAPDIPANLHAFVPPPGVRSLV
jgi:hypothetical protein